MDGRQCVSAEVSACSFWSCNLCCDFSGAPGPSLPSLKTSSWRTGVRGLPQVCRGLAALTHLTPVPEVNTWATRTQSAGIVLPQPTRRAPGLLPSLCHTPSCRAPPGVRAPSPAGATARPGILLWVASWARPAPAGPLGTMGPCHPVARSWTPLAAGGSGGAGRRRRAHPRLLV